LPITSVSTVAIDCRTVLTVALPKDPGLQRNRAACRLSPMSRHLQRRQCC